MKSKHENNKIKNIFTRWFVAIAWGLVGYGIAGIFSIGYLKLNSWITSIIGEYSLLWPTLPLLGLGYLLSLSIKKFASFKHLYPRIILTFPPRWLTFWIGYLTFLFSPPFSLTEVKTILPTQFEEYPTSPLFFPVLLFLLCAFDWINIVFQGIGSFWKAMKQVYGWIENLFTKKKKAPSLSLRKIILAQNTHSTNPEVISRLKDWASNATPLTEKEDDLFGIEGAIQEIFEYINEPGIIKSQKVLGVFGSFGAGKSTLIEFALEECKSRSHANVVIPILISCWKFAEPAAVDAYILTRIAQSLREEVDVLALPSLPEYWINAIKGTLNNKYASLLSIFQNIDLDDALIELEEALHFGKIHLILIIEDGDRRNASTFDMGSLQRLLEHLKMIKRLSIIIAADPAHADPQNGHLDLKRLCDNWVVASQADASLIEKLLDTLVFTLGPNDFEWDSQRATFFPFIWERRHSTEKHLDYVSAREFGMVLNTPRKLKRFIRRLLQDWERLSGEVNFYDLFLICFIKESFPTALNFLMVNIDLLYQQQKDAEYYTSPASTQKMTSLVSQSLKPSWFLLCEALSSPHERIVVQKIMATLFPENASVFLENPQVTISSKFYSRGKQRIISSPIYWRRALEGRLDPDDISDKSILKIHSEWRNSALALDTTIFKSNMDSLPKNLLNPIFAARWQHLSLDLNLDELFRLTNDYANLIFPTENIRASFDSNSLAFHLMKRGLNIIANDPNKHKNDLSHWLQDAIKTFASKNIHMTLSLCRLWGTEADSPGRIVGIEKDIIKIHQNLVNEKMVSLIQEDSQSLKATWDLLPDRTLLQIVAYWSGSYSSPPKPFIHDELIGSIPSWLPLLVKNSFKHSSFRQRAIQTIVDFICHWEGSFLDETGTKPGKFAISEKCLEWLASNTGINKKELLESLFDFQSSNLPTWVCDSIKSESIQILKRLSL